MARVRYFSLSICHPGSFIQQAHTHFQRWVLTSSASVPLQCAAFTFITTLSTFFVGILPVCISCFILSSSRAQACFVTCLLPTQHTGSLAVLENEEMSLRARFLACPCEAPEVVWPFLHQLWLGSPSDAHTLIPWWPSAAQYFWQTSRPPAAPVSGSSLLLSISPPGLWGAPCFFELLCTTHSYHFSGFQIISKLLKINTSDLHISALTSMVLKFLVCSPGGTSKSLVSVLASCPETFT